MSKFVEEQVEPQAPALVRRLYLDESGHGGDVAGGGGFAQQRLFTLACVGVGEPRLLVSELERLRAEFKIPPGELKSKTLKTRLTPIALALIAFFRAQGWPIFIEAVDKRYFLAIHIVQHMLCGDLNGGYVDQVSRNAMAELLADWDAAPAFTAYMGACREPSIEKIRIALQTLWDWLETRDEEIARTTQILTMFARDRAGRADADPLGFLPLADIGPGGRPVWILPNLQCLTNIYARINLWAGRQVKDLQLIHHAQLQYESVLRDGKTLMEALGGQGAEIWTPFADYGLEESASLRFASSDEEPCIQAADIVAGAVMRCMRRSLEDPASLFQYDKALLEALVDLGNPFTANGVNFVMTTRDLDRTGVPTAAPHLDSGWR
ncbi:DUF3800 domain-containing protein [Caulobacter sp. RL271]|uniref:DUF3800 domain-containing protein n=1 Tax=Caulobacter segnis TaxID=88688 RepID=A0ABY5A2S6_9CAUL|nr:DUF3800 domain-containing protein [Caulobacter segnis]USQ98436.1 DUF3800 domain-containing protein [Caulobacter segnis]